jgi:integrase
MSNRTFERARDSRGRPVKGIYTRDGRFYVGASVAGKWTMAATDATTLTEARAERENMLADHRAGRIARRTADRFDDLFHEWQSSRPISEQTAAKEATVRRLYLADLSERRVQDVTPRDVARVLTTMRDDGLSEWSRTHTWRVMRGVFAFSVLRGVLTRDPTDGLSRAERPRQRNKQAVARLDAATLERLVLAAPDERWKAALGLAAFGGLRAGEVRAVEWRSIDFGRATISVSRSALADGTIKSTKTASGTRTVPILPALRRLLVAWKVRSPRTADGDLVICTATGSVVAGTNLRRVLRQATTAAGLDEVEGRLSLHSLRHSFDSHLVTDLGLAPTTAAAILGHSDPATTFRLYARDARDPDTMVADVLQRAAGAGIGA